MNKVITIAACFLSLSYQLRPTASVSSPLRRNFAFLAPCRDVAVRKWCAPRPTSMPASNVQPRQEHSLLSLRVATGSENPMKNVPEFVSDANKAIVSNIKDSLGMFYGDRHYARFYALETIARVPYFAYTSVLHLYETLGWCRRADLMKIHFAESWNELHHLLIMEELGGSDIWADRVVAVHLAFFYYWIAIALYMTSPAVAYNLNEQVERHAFDTYDKFLMAHEKELKALPAPTIAKQYYQTGDLYMFDEFHTTTPQSRRRPQINNLYDVFINIRNDEREHYQTMEAMQAQPLNDKKVVRSPNNYVQGHAEADDGNIETSKNDRQ